MSKRLLFSFFFIILYCISNAQTKSLEYEFNGGVNLNSPYGNRGTSMSAGYNVEGYIKPRVGKHFSIKTGLQYEQNGWAYRSLILESNITSGSSTSDIIYKLNYLNLPILGEYSIGRRVKFYADGGVFIGALLNSVILEKQKQSASNQVNIIKSSSDYYRRINFGVSIGVGTRIPLASKVNLVFDVKNNLGLTNIAKTTSNSTMKTNAISISSGLAFFL